MTWFLAHIGRGVGVGVEVETKISLTGWDVTISPVLAVAVAVTSFQQGKLVGFDVKLT